MKNEETNVREFAVWAVRLTLHFLVSEYRKHASIHQSCSHIWPWTMHILGPNDSGYLWYGSCRSPARIPTTKSILEFQPNQPARASLPEVVVHSIDRCILRNIQLLNTNDVQWNENSPENHLTTTINECSIHMRPNNVIVSNQFGQLLLHVSANRRFANACHALFLLRILFHTMHEVIGRLVRYLHLTVWTQLEKERKY